MLTRCPTCQSWFRVRAEHLSAASGYVTCGQCDAVFNALATLVEESAPPVAPAAPRADAVPVPPASRPPDDVAQAQAAVAEKTDARAVAPEAPPEPAAAALPTDGEPATPPAAADETRAAAPTVAADGPPPVPGNPPQAASAAEREDAAPPAAAVIPDAAEPAPGDAPGGDLADEWSAEFDAMVDADAGAPEANHADEPERATPGGATLSAAEHAILFTEPGSGDDDEDEGEDEDADAAGAAASADSTGDDAETDATVPDAVPPVIESEVAALAGVRPGAARGANLWRAALLLLAVALLAQGVFALRAPLAAAWPASRPWLEAMCARLGCQPEAAPQDTVRLLARDVREHPQYRDALLVNATLVNRGGAPQPYPVLELRLKDGNGMLVGARRFAPGEYLDHSIDVDAGMPPGQPIYVVMELGGDAAAATSFEFSFL